jgi:hypothetical protein
MEESSRRYAELTALRSRSGNPILELINEFEADIGDSDDEDEAEEGEEGEEDEGETSSNFGACKPSSKRRRNRSDSETTAPGETLSFQELKDQFESRILLVCKYEWQRKSNRAGSYMAADQVKYPKNTITLLVR